MHTFEATVIIYAHRRHCKRGSRMKGISPTDISIWIERATIHIRPLGWNELRKIYILVLNLSLEIASRSLQTLTHITVCCRHEKRRGLVVDHLVYYSYYYWCLPFVPFVSLFDSIPRFPISWSSLTFPSTVLRVFSARRLIDGRRWNVGWNFSRLKLATYVAGEYREMNSYENPLRRAKVEILNHAIICKYDISQMNLSCWIIIYYNKRNLRFYITR